MTRLELTRAQILAFRRRTGALDDRLPQGRESLRRAAWAGLQDSMPRAALLSIHARVQGTQPSTWEDPSLVQTWGPRFSVFVVAECDIAVFTLGRLPEDAAGRRRAMDLADRLDAALAGGTMLHSEAERALGLRSNMLRYAAAAGTVRLRWDGARQPALWTGAKPRMEAREARVELARRYLHIYGPATAEAFGRWAGLRAEGGPFAFDALCQALTPVATPVGDAWILAEDEEACRAAAGPAAPARLLPSGDAFLLAYGSERELLVPNPDHRAALWPTRVWPGGVLVGGDVAGTWRRSGGTLGVRPWRRLSGPERDAVEAEARSLPLPGFAGRMAVRWEA